MSGVPFELQRAAASAKGPRGDVFSWTYAQSGNKRGHELVRDGAGVRMARSSWTNPRTITGTCLGTADALDISLALVLEGVYTRNLSTPGALVSLPGRFLNRFNDL
ncbi:hypothetical protein ACFV0T_13000 [Streptomyces sp. NPDC059582]|uniref:hypothetical protein n=1 Tax=Streptomyces sp. NPDC059582 TaxID=3346875 RepID=UPI0036B95F69